MVEQTNITTTDSSNTDNKGQITPELVQEYLKTPDGLKLIQPIIDSSNSKAIKTYTEKTLPKLLEDEIAKRYPTETEEQKLIRESILASKKATEELQRERMMNKAIVYANEIGFPIELIDDTVLAQDYETTKSNIEKRNGLITTLIQKQVELRFKEGGTTVVGDNNKKGLYTVDDLKTMSDEDLYKNRHLFK